MRSPTNPVGATLRPEEGHFADFYVLNLDQTSPVATGTRGQRGGFNLTTVGARYFGALGDWRLDAEGALQAGSVVDRDSFAGMTSWGVGHVFKDAPMKPQVWAYYDYASGTDDPTGPNTILAGSITVTEAVTLVIPPGRVTLVMGIARAWSFAATMALVVISCITSRAAVAAAVVPPDVTVMKSFRFTVPVTEASTMVPRTLAAAVLP